MKEAEVKGIAETKQLPILAEIIIALKEGEGE